MATETEWAIENGFYTFDGEYPILGIYNDVDYDDDDTPNDEDDWDDWEIDDHRDEEVVAFYWDEAKARKHAQERCELAFRQADPGYANRGYIVFKR